MASIQYAREQAKRREQDLETLVKAKNMEASRQWERIRIDSRTVILRPVGSSAIATAKTSAEYVDKVEHPVVPRQRKCSKPHAIQRLLTEEQIEELESIYYCTSNRDLANRYGVTISNIQAYAVKKKLHKSLEFKSANARAAALRGRELSANKNG